MLTKFDADFNPVPESDRLKPSREFIERRIDQSLREMNILCSSPEDLSDELLIGNVRVTLAALLQIQVMWWSARPRETYDLAPTIPLKYLTFGLGYKDRKHTVDVEIYPGIDDWTP